MLKYFISSRPLIKSQTVTHYLISSVSAAEAKSALGNVFVRFLLLLPKAKGEGGKAFGLAEVHLRVAELFR